MLPAVGAQLVDLNGLSPNAAFLYEAVFKTQQSYEAARRYFTVLRGWAETGKVYRGRTFTGAQVEEAILAYERSVAQGSADGEDILAGSAVTAASCGAGVSSSSSSGGGLPSMATIPAAAPSVAAHNAGGGSHEVPVSETAPPTKKPRLPGSTWWPRWAIDTEVGVEVLSPGGQGFNNQGPIWMPATPVGIGYRGQKRHFLFVRAPTFEMDARRSEVRPRGGGATVEELHEALVQNGGNPMMHPGWTDGRGFDTAGRAGRTTDMCFPGVAPHDSKGTSEEMLATLPDAAADVCEELAGDFERMALLQRSKLVKIPTSDHPDPLSEPRAAASIRLPPLTDGDVLMLHQDTALKRLSSLQVETVTLAARRFRQSTSDGRATGYVIGDGTGCGKGRCIAAVLLHLWNTGIRRHIWVSATNDLYYDACRDLKDLGADIPCVPLRKIAPSAPLDKWGTEANREMFKHLGAEGDGVIFVTYSLLVQTGQRRELIAVPVKTEESRAILLADLLDERLHITRAAEFGSEGGSVSVRKGDRVVSVQTLRQLQVLEVPFTLTLERVLEKKKGSDKETNKFSGKSQSRGGKQGKEENSAAGEDAETAEIGKEEGKSAKPNDIDYTPSNSRLGQLVEWLGGENARGLICYDEVHKAKNLVPDKDDAASTKTGLFVDLLQKYCPKSPVLYVSATAATEVKHLGYMGRLGLWGPGTTFEDFQDFAKTMESGGVAAMEMLALNMKAIGALSCKQLAYVGTEFETVQVGLTSDQRATYDRSCLFWQRVLREYEVFTNNKEMKLAYAKRFFNDKLKKMENESEAEEVLGKRLWQFFWGAQQRFFKAMCNAAKVPAAAEIAREAVANGEQVLLSIWATGESRSAARMVRLKDETPGRVVIDDFSEGSLVKVTVKDPVLLAKIAAQLYANRRLKVDIEVGYTRVRRLSQLLEVHGRRLKHPQDLNGATLPAQLLFRSSMSRSLEVQATLSATGEPVRFELKDDEFGERVIVAKVLEGPPSFRRATVERWHVKMVAGRPLGKINTQRLTLRLRKGQSMAFHDPLVADHLSGPEMILEHFIKTIFLTQDAEGNDIPWAIELKEKLMEDMRELKLPPNAMDELVDLLGGPRRVAEMSGRHHRMKRKKDGSLAYVARSEELRCSADGMNLVEQEFFQKGVKKCCIVTEVASAGISLHADRRQLRKDFTPPRRLFLAVELPWGADKAIQVFGRVHRANQLQPPRFKMLCTPIGGENRFTTAIARRMKLLGAVTKGDRFTSMGGGADRHMAEFDLNNNYGKRALAVLYTDTTSVASAAPDLIATYEALPFIGSSDDSTAGGRWPNWEAFAHDVNGVWRLLHLIEEMDFLKDECRQHLGTKECDVMNRFLNRILMLEIEMQNAMYETFHAIYTELVRIDRANGDFDEGVQNLNEWQGRRIQRVEVEEREVLYTDPGSGAETCYARLSLDRGVTWQAAKETYDQMQSRVRQGFYAYRRSAEDHPEYLLVKEREQIGGAGSSAATWHARRRVKLYITYRPDLGADFGSWQLPQLLDENWLDKTCFERIGDSVEELRDVEASWTRRYDESGQSRIVRVHILTGDVLSAWRLTKGQQKDEEATAEKAKFHIVRAVTQPDNVPVVGLEVSEADLPKLRYVLACQHQAVREKPVPADEKKSVRDLTMEVATYLLDKLCEAEEKKLPYASWLEVHKSLTDDGRIRNGTEGMRAVQQAINRLVRQDLVIKSATEMELKDKEFSPPSGESLEQVIFPEEFIQLPANSDAEEDGSSAQDEHNDAVEQEEREDDDQEETQEVMASGKASPKKRKHRKHEGGKGSRKRHKKRKKMAQALFGSDCESDPDKGSAAGSEEGPSPVPEAHTSDAAFVEQGSAARSEEGPSSAPELHPSDAALVKQIARIVSSTDLATTTMRAVRAELERHFSLDPGALDDRRERIGELLSAEVQRISAQGVGEASGGQEPSALPAKRHRKHKEAKEAKERKPRRGKRSSREDDEGMFESLFGHQGPGEGVSKASGPDERGNEMEEAAVRVGRPPASPATSAAPQTTLSADTSSTADSATAASAEPGVALPIAVERENGEWTYEVTGNKLAIRQRPDIESAAQGYLKSGELFKVLERVQGGLGDGRVYLRLADGRGFAYDRSAKDFDKLVVREVTTGPS